MVSAKTRVTHTCNNLMHTILVLNALACILTLHLQCHWYQVLCCLCHDELAHLCAACEGHLHTLQLISRQLVLVCVGSLFKVYPSSYSFEKELLSNKAAKVCRHKQSYS